MCQTVSKQLAKQNKIGEIGEKLANLMIIGRRWADFLDGSANICD